MWSNTATYAEYTSVVPTFVPGPVTTQVYEPLFGALTAMGSYAAFPFRWMPIETNRTVAALAGFHWISTVEPTSHVSPPAGLLTCR